MAKAHSDCADYEGVAGIDFINLERLSVVVFLRFQIVAADKGKGLEVLVNFALGHSDQVKALVHLAENSFAKFVGKAGFPSGQARHFVAKNLVEHLYYYSAYWANLQAKRAFARNSALWKDNKNAPGRIERPYLRLRLQWKVYI